MFTLIIALLLENVTPPRALNWSNTVFLFQLINSNNFPVSVDWWQEELEWEVWKPGLWTETGGQEIPGPHQGHNRQVGLSAQERREGGVCGWLGMGTASCESGILVSIREELVLERWRMGMWFCPLTCVYVQTRGKPTVGWGNWKTRNTTLKQK